MGMVGVPKLQISRRNQQALVAAVHPEYLSATIFFEDNVLVGDPVPKDDIIGGVSDPQVLYSSCLVLYVTPTSIKANVSGNVQSELS